MPRLYNFFKEWIQRAAPLVGFVALYVFLDWFTYIHPFYGLNITPWNPPPALGILLWLRRGPKVALPWFIAIFLSEMVVRDLPAGWWLTTCLSIQLTAGYGLIAEWLRWTFRRGTIFHSRKRLFIWASTVTVGSLVNSLVYISLLYGAARIPSGHWLDSFVHFAIGDFVGITITMPIFWILASDRVLHDLRKYYWHWETAGYLGLLALILYVLFGLIKHYDVNHFYLLFLPIAWAASRHGMRGAAMIVFVMELFLSVILKLIDIGDNEIFELQLLCANLALVGYFVAVVVDEQKRAVDQVRISLRLASAGEMAAAMTHELNQPMAALSAYGKVCEYLLNQGDSGSALRETLQKMINESKRAADVVRRLRDFFQNGSMKLEPIPTQEIVLSIAEQFQAQLHDHGIVLSIGPVPATQITVDRVQIEIVIRNLIRNAIDAALAGPEGNRHIVLSIDMVENRQLRFTVEDSGTGVSSAIAEKLFEPFVSSKSSGLGLGLVLSRMIVEAHGGKLWAEVASHGIFRFLLPISEQGE